MRRLLPLLLVLALPLAAEGQPAKMGPAKRPEVLKMPAPAAALKLPEEVTGEPDEYVRVTAETAAPAVVWYSPDAGLKLFPPDLLKDTRTAVVSARKPGRYRLVGFATHGGLSSMAECVVVIEGPDPGPGPDPKPPPGPGPAPTPLDLVLRAAWAKESDPKRAEHLALLVNFYRVTAPAVAEKTAQKTWGGLFTELAGMHVFQLPRGVLPSVQAGISAELKAALPTSAAAPLDATGRALAKTAFGRVAASLESLTTKGKR